MATATKMQEQIGTKDAVAEIVRLSDTLSVRRMDSLARTAELAGGKLLAVRPEGKRVASATMTFDWPPRKQQDFVSFLDTLVHRRINCEVLVNGITAPDAIQLQVSRQVFR